MNSDISDIENRIIDKLISIDKKIDDLCNRMTTIETKWEDMLVSEREKIETKFKVISIIFGIITTSAILFNIFK